MVVEEGEVEGDQEIWACELVFLHPTLYVPCAFGSRRL